jgi:hypothetical protein
MGEPAALRSGSIFAALAEETPVKTINAFRLAFFALALIFVPCGLLSQPASSQTVPTFMVLYRPAPPPDDPNEWVIVVPSDSNLQALYAVGFRPAPTPFGSYATAAEAKAAADGFVTGNFPKECRKAFSVFYNATTGAQEVVEDFAQKPFGARRLMPWSAVTL